MKLTANESSYRLDTVDGEWNDNTVYEGGNMGHRARTKGGYFPVMPIDSGVI